MGMKVKFDVKEIPPKRETPKTSALIEQIKIFLGSNYKNMVLEFDTENEAVSRAEMSLKYRRKNNLQDKYESYRKKNIVYFVRPDKVVTSNEDDKKNTNKKGAK